MGTQVLDKTYESHFGPVASRVEHGLAGDQSADRHDEQSPDQLTLGIAGLHAVGVAALVQLEVGIPQVLIDPRTRPIGIRAPIQDTLEVLVEDHAVPAATLLKATSDPKSLQRQHPAGVR